MIPFGFTNLKLGQHVTTLNTILGTFIVGVHKRNVSPQNHFQNTTLNDHYTYDIIYLVDFFFH